MADNSSVSLDIVFLMDATASMHTCIARLKDNLNVFIGTLTTKDANNSNPVNDWRAKIVGYRDVESEGSNWYEDNPFTRDVDQLKRQLAALNAEGGGDEPESLLDALYKVANMGQSGKWQEEHENKWRYRAIARRVVIVFTDASFKEKTVLPEAAGADVKDIINHINSNRLILLMIAPASLECFASLAEADRSEYIETREDNGNPVSLDIYIKDQKRFEDTLRQLAIGILRQFARAGIS